MLRLLLWGYLHKKIKKYGQADIWYGSANTAISSDIVKQSSKAINPNSKPNHSKKDKNRNKSRTPHRC